MSIFIGGLSALNHWDSECVCAAPWSSIPECVLQPPLSSGIAYAQVSSLDGPAMTDQELRDALSQCLRCQSAPVETLVATPKDRRPTKFRSCRVWGGPLPEQSLAEVGPGCFASTPAFCFLQMSSRLGMTDLVRLGFELCGTYSCVNRGVCRPALVSKAQLGDYIRSNQGLPGQTKALRALDFVCDHSGSPMETVVAMLLCLPLAWGGFGLPLPCMNHPIRNLERDPITGYSTYYCDLFWPTKKLDAEYDSDLFHTGRDQHLKDSIRLNALQDTGIRVISIASGQLESYAGFKKVASQIARHLNHRIRFDRGPADWEHRSRGLHRQLLEPYFHAQR